MHSDGDVTLSGGCCIQKLRYSYATGQAEQSPERSQPGERAELSAVLQRAGKPATHGCGRVAYLRRG